MDALYLLYFPLLGLIAYPNQKRMIRIALGVALASIQLSTLSRVFDMSVVGLGLGIYSLAVPYTVIINKKKSKPRLLSCLLLVMLFLASVYYLLARMSCLISVLKIVLIILTDIVGLLSLEIGFDKRVVAFTLIIYSGLILGISTKSMIDIIFLGITWILMLLCIIAKKIPS